MITDPPNPHRSRRRRSRPTQTPSPVPEQPAPVDTIPAPTPTTSLHCSHQQPCPRALPPSGHGDNARPRRGEHAHAQRPLQPDGSGVPAHEVARAAAATNGCLRLADDAYAPRGGRTGTALRQWYRAKRNGFGHRNRYALIGAQLFWRTSNPPGRGHLRRRGLVVTNVGSGWVKIMSWRALDRWGPYLGWAEPSTSRADHLLRIVERGLFSSP